MNAGNDRAGRSAGKGRRGMARRRMFPVLLVAPVLMLSTGAAGAVAAADGAASGEPKVLLQTDRVTVVADGNWVRRNYRDALTGSSQRTHTGVRITAENGVSGCRFSGRETITDNELPPGRVRISREVAFNNKDCVLLTEEGTVLRSDLQDEPADSAGPTVEEEAGMSGTSSFGLSAAAAAATKSRYHETRYEDPPNFDVTRVRAKLTWTYTGTCVTNSWNHIGEHYWLSGTGWSKESSNTTASRTCTGGAYTNVYGKYRNGLFCKAILAWLPPPLGLAWALLQPATYNEYNRTRIRGNPSGSFTSFWNASKWGGCDSLLTFERRTAEF
jgi:hypothetical protein